jgi:hypothetical protein
MQADKYFPHPSKRYTIRFSSKKFANSMHPRNRKAAVVIPQENLGFLITAF